MGNLHLNGHPQGLSGHRHLCVLHFPLKPVSSAHNSKGSLILCQMPVFLTDSKCYKHTLVSFTVDFHAGVFRESLAHTIPLKSLGESLRSQPLGPESRKALHPHAGRIAWLRCEWLRRRRDVELLSNKVVDKISDLCMLLIAEYFFPHLKSTFLRPSNKLIQKLW